MKRFISGLLVLLQIFHLGIIVSTSAKSSNSLSDDEAKEIISQALDFHNAIHWHYNIDMIFEIEKCIEKEISVYSYDLHEYFNLKWIYFPIDETRLPGGSYEGLKDYARSIYVDKIADEMYNTHKHSYYNDIVPMFHITESGSVYMLSGLGVPVYTVWDTANDPFGAIDKEDVVVEVVESSETEATVRFLFNVGFDRPNPVWIECELIKSSNGWRINKSAFTDMLRYGWQGSTIWEPTLAPYSPSTGDENVSRVWWLAGVSLAALVPAALLVQRRRRKED